MPRRATMAMPWATAERPQRWGACYRWFKDSWTSAVVGDALRYAPVHYAELCPLEREPYLQPAPGRPPRNEGTAAAASVLGQLAGRTVLFNGDSISVQHWMATACALLPGATSHSRMTVGSFAAADRKRQSSVGSVAAADSTRQSSGRPATPNAMCVSLRSGLQRAVRVCYARLEPAELRVAVDSLSSQDVLVINWGVQLHTAAGKVLGLLANYTAATVRAAADRPQRARPLIIWRETAPQHFPGGNGNFGTVKSWWATTNASCLPTEHPYRGYNELTSPIVRAAGIPILPVWEPSLPHHRAHVGWKPLRGGRTLDCTHFCLASGLLDHWVELLMATMLPSLTR